MKLGYNCYSSTKYSYKYGGVQVSTGVLKQEKRAVVSRSTLKRET